MGKQIRKGRMDFTKDTHVTEAPTSWNPLPTLFLTESDRKQKLPVKRTTLVKHDVPTKKINCISTFTNEVKAYVVFESV